MPGGAVRIYATMDNLRAHKACDVLLFGLAHPRWECTFQPKYAAYLDPIDSWWKTPESLAIKARFFKPGSRSRRR